MDEDNTEVRVTELEDDGNELVAMVCCYQREDGSFRFKIDAAKWAQPEIRDTMAEILRMVAAVAVQVIGNGPPKDGK